MKCPICRTDGKFVRTIETIQHRNMTERKKYCLQCGSAWKTMEQFFDLNETDVNREAKNVECKM